MTLPFDLTPMAALFMGAVFLVASLVRGYSGFGYSAMVVTASALVTNPLNFVAVVVALETAMSLQALRGIGRDIDWRRVGLLTGGAVVGLPLGLWVLTGLSENAVRAVIASVVLLMCAILLTGWRLPREMRGTGVNFGFGMLSGLANAPGMGGMPLIPFFAAQPMAPAVFRATLIAYFPILDLYSAPLYWAAGLVSWDTLWASALAMPITLLGNWLGGRHFFSTDPQNFRRFAIALLAALALAGLLKAVI